LSDAPQRFAAAAAAFGAIPSPALAPPEAGRLQALAQARHDERLSLLVASLTAAGA